MFANSSSRFLALAQGDNDHFIALARKTRVQILVCACPHYIVIKLSTARISSRQQFGLRLTVDHDRHKGHFFNLLIRYNHLDQNALSAVGWKKVVGIIRVGLYLVKRLERRPGTQNRTEESEVPHAVEYDPIFVNFDALQDMRVMPQNQ